MKSNKRVFLIVLDSFGIGYAPDAADFGDVGANTLKSVASTGILDINTMISLGLANIDGVDHLQSIPHPIGTYARLKEKSLGKDTTTGHWEISGITLDHPFPTYPNGFPSEVITEFERSVGRKILCNRPYSGTQVIADYGEEHIRTGRPIVYTSADSVFQIAAHVDVISKGQLYSMCEIARNILVGKHGVGRVIARPFEGTFPSFKRTQSRRDFSLTPPRETMLNTLSNKGFDVIGVGKIGDIFALSGITKSYPTHNNDEGMQKTSELLASDFCGLCFVNLVDFDMLYGHRRDPVGYANALNEFDMWLSEFIGSMKENDLLIITADHGCDPSFSGTDHTREYVPFLTIKGSHNEAGKDLGTIEGFDFIAKTIGSYLAK